MINKTSLSRVLYICIFSISTLLSFGQKRLAIYDIDVIEKSKQKLITISGFGSDNSSENYSKIPEYILSNYSNDKRFIIIDKKNQQLIKDEKERQKSESFIDGYIVEQGKQEGADYILRSFITNQGKTLVVRVYDVANNKILCESERNTRSYKVAVKDIIQELNETCFSLAHEVVRIEESKKNKVKSLLILGGRSQNISIRNNVELFEIVDEEINGNKFKRRNIIGSGIVSKVQDENFSSVKIMKGGEEIFEKLNGGSKLFCVIK